MGVEKRKSLNYKTKEKVDGKLKNSKQKTDKKWIENRKIIGKKQVKEGI